jgi:hypothetical protein
MTEAAKDLNHYLNNLDELGDLSDDQIEALANPQGTATEATPAEDKGDTESAATPGGTADVQPNGDEQQPDGILARDGKHVIPYSRLEAAEQRARDLAKQLEELSNKRAEGQPAGEQDAATTDSFLSDDELDELDRDLPALAKVIRGQQSQLRAMAGKVEELSKGHETQQQQEEAAATQSWNEALDKNPKAKFLDATLPLDVGQKFIDVTASLHDDWANMSHEARADAIVRQYEAVHGEVKVTAIAAKPGNTPPAPVKAPAKPDVPVSMAGIPGGSAPPVDEAAALLSKSGAELTHDFMAMTPEQIEASLNRL